jgi:hypothetical protein
MKQRQGRCAASRGASTARPVIFSTKGVSVTPVMQTVGRPGVPRPAAILSLYSISIWYGLYPPIAKAIPTIKPIEKFFISTDPTANYRS